MLLVKKERNIYIKNDITQYLNKKYMELHYVLSIKLQNNNNKESSHILKENIIQDAELHIYTYNDVKIIHNIISKYEYKQQIWEDFNDKYK